MIRLETSRLKLTPVSLADYDDLVSLWSMADFTRHICGQPLKAEEVWSRCLRDIGHWQALGHGNWVIRDPDSDSLIGTVGVLDYRRTIQPAMQDPELGWGLHPDFQGRGLAFEAVSAALEWTDTHLPAERTLCMISPENTPSIRLAHKLGYQPMVTTEYKASQVILYERPRSFRP